MTQRTYAPWPSHARMTAAMQRLGASPYKILSHLRRIIPDGTTRHLSQAQIARATGLSESTVSLHMPALVSAGYIVRTRPQDGRGHGYAITVVAPSFQRPEKGSIVDPFSHAPESSIATPQTAPEKGSIIDPSLLIDHEHQQQQQREADSDLLQEFAGDDPQVVQQVLAANPNLTVVEFFGQVQVATERPDVRNPRGLALHCLSLGQRVTPARRAEPRPDRARSRAAPRDQFVDPAYAAAYTAAQRAANAGDAVPPNDATPDELVTWRHYTEHGDFTPVEALNLLLMARYHDQRQALIPSREARYVRR